MLVRLDRRSRLAALRPSILRVTFDAYNLLNSSVTTTINETFGSRWQSPTQVMLARFVKFGGQFTF